MVLFVATGLQMSANAQENSPYSRYGIGDLTPNRNVFTRGMGGVSAGVADFNPFTTTADGTLIFSNTNSINFANPASLAGIYKTTFDVGTEIDYRILKNTNPAKKFTSANTYVSYLQLAFPLASTKMKKKGITWGMSLGLKPVSKINYKIEKTGRLTTTTSNDSLHTLFEGTGGLNQAQIGTGLKYKNFSIGINAGYMFGSKDYSTKLTFINDSAYHYLSNSENKTTFGSFFINGGIQYDLPLAKVDNKVTRNLRLGVYGNLQQNLNASNDIIRERIVFDPNGIQFRVDSVYEVRDVKGKIKLPAMFSFGGLYQDAHWQIGADFDYSNWASYRYYDSTDQVQNNWSVRAGVQYYPAKLKNISKKYFNNVKYRVGAYYGPDYIRTGTSNRAEYGFSVGTGMPLQKTTGDGSYVVLNTALEFASRGNKQTNVRESLVRFSIGVSMNALWFRKPKYN